VNRSVEKGEIVAGIPAKPLHKSHETIETCKLVDEKE
jgi:hypothetical protein